MSRRRFTLQLWGLLACLVWLTSSFTANAGALAPDRPVVTTKDCGNGVSVVTYQRSPQLKALTASDSELAVNGLPARPKDAKTLALWRTFVTHPITQLTRCPTPGRPGHALRPSTVNPQKSGNQSANWSGNVANGRGYTDAEATWQIPAGGGSSGTAWSTQWVGVGLGNTASYPLFQAGTNTHSPGYYDEFFEVWPQQPLSQTITTSVAAHDTVSAHVTASASGASFHVSNLTRGLDGHYSWTNTTKGPDGHAEWIGERPYLDHGTTFPRYAIGDVTFNSAQAYAPANGWAALGALPHYYESMFTCDSNTVLATPGPISANGLSFTDIWKAYGRSEPVC